MNSAGMTLCMVLGFAIFQIASASSAEPVVKTYPTVQLGKGEQRLIWVGPTPLQRYSVGGNAIRVLAGQRLRKISARLKNYLMIRGEKNGFSDLMLFLSNGDLVQRRFRVRPSQKSDIFLNLLNQLKEVEVVYLEDQAILRGEFHSIQEARAILNLRSAFPKKTDDKTLPASTLLETTRPKLLKWIEEKRSSRPDLEISLESPPGHPLLVRADMSSSEDARILRAEVLEIAPFATLRIRNLSKGETLYLQVYLVEIKKNQFESFGVRWPGETNAFQVTPTRFEEHFDFQTQLNASAANGELRLLAEPKLVVKSPGEAELFSGGELPIRINTRYKSAVLWKPYGVRLKIQVKEVLLNSVHLAIETDVSDLDYHAKNDDLPGLRFNRLKTEIRSEMGRPLMLCGLIREGRIHQRTGLPLLGQIPMLGRLFSLSTTEENRSELVAFLIPNLRPPPPQLPRPFKGGGFPKGPVPASRDWIAPATMQEVSRDSDFPWTILE